MATVLFVHGTYAHWDGRPSESAAPGAEPQWWQRGSSTEADLQRFIEGADGEVRQERFLWNGDNSEIERRKAGARLLARLRELEAEGEKYCLIGHSHGGSVIASALTMAAAKKVALPGLQRWMTVGTPFVGLRKEATLFLRLTLFQKAMFVASLMLLFMFAFYVLSEFLTGGLNLDNQNQLYRIGFNFLLMSLPLAVFWAIFKYLDMRQLYLYRPSVLKRARESFAPRWLGLWHQDDEAISGLSSVGSIKLKLFHRDFAVPALSLLSVFLLPMIYLFIVTSPNTMISIAEWLRDDIYQIAAYEDDESKIVAARQEVRQLRRSLRGARSELERAKSDNEVGDKLEAREKVRSLEKRIRDARERLFQENPELQSVERAVRFKRRFLQENGRRCANGSLCGQGRNVALNSRLLLHIVTDEATSLVLEEDMWGGRTGWIVRNLIPIFLVPIVFGLLAAILVLAVQFIARFVSSILSSIFDSLTWHEVKRNVLGNDTETEVALTARPHPPWLDASPPPLPGELSARLTEVSNEAAAQSLWKFRNAIGELAFTDGMDNKQQSVFDYLTWRELIHSSYFELPEFRWLLAEAIAREEGFKPSGSFNDSQEQRSAASWVVALAPPATGEATSSTATA